MSNENGVCVTEPTQIQLRIQPKKARLYAAF